MTAILIRLIITNKVNQTDCAIVIEQIFDLQKKTVDHS